MRYFVERENGKIVGFFARPQPGTAEEEVHETDPELRVFTRSLEPSQSRPWLRWIAWGLGVVFGSGFALAGVSGLVIAGGTMADVETLKQESRTNADVRAHVAGIKVELRALKDELEQQREDAGKRDGKLDRILERLPATR